MNSGMMKREGGRKERKQTEMDKQQQQSKGMRDYAWGTQLGLVSGCCLVNLVWAPWPHGDE